ncbi:N-acetylneuraminic acid synthase domain-containing protein [Alkalidesulfovibrio alkalitolerans DSM 16529]|uniref:N-acetylneuraminic acid synthase domain-containing protein n=2 Tax=Alkalidesulfovibrio alkalitolerans TaxID=293256 RepID=S7UTA0_9BACT|nr:N-acetylneuraminic acid synthase domain-containing protein [Alkalidesulfovibrio alkalitolerans DSM 16529]
MPRVLTIDGQSIADDTGCFVIAEVGHNHQGNLETCMEMMKVAKECGADAVKLQKRNNKTFFTRAMYDSPYCSENSYGSTYGEHREALEFDVDQYSKLIEYAKELGIVLFATAFDLESADFLESLHMPLYKIASSDIVNTPLLKKVASYGKPMIVSTGGVSIEDVRRAYETIRPINENFCFLQCTAAYPVQDYKDFNLRVIDTYRREFPDVVIGLSDHESGISMATAAYVLGARVVEKHFTLNRSWKGTDQSFSLAPGGLRRLVRDLRRVHLALGDGVKRPYDVERAPLTKMVKKLVAARDLSAGTRIRETDVIFRVTGRADGMLPYQLDEIVGKTLTRDMAEEECFSPSDVK